MKNTQNIEAIDITRLSFVATIIAIAPVKATPRHM